jgi:hypothetical protein
LETKQIYRNKGYFIILCFNFRVVTTTEAEEFAKERGILYFEVSAKTGVGIS